MQIKLIDLIAQVSLSVADSRLPITILAVSLYHINLGVNSCQYFEAGVTTDNKTAGFYLYAMPFAFD